MVKKDRQKGVRVRQGSKKRQAERGLNDRQRVGKGQARGVNKQATETRKTGKVGEKQANTGGEGGTGNHPGCKKTGN